ncbi:precorrin-6y C5,15-methyltransferase (decarboxylating) subunit CbiE [Aneurinibacillus sp. Ricciae_BoGa-3]|uniref:precorrin-6y C5,15-methyltransferase (decarboxylating) subunit CbiE n=1 Tax=Aneurinibacillus sp. Ricciae_BoGa-3 TaxID=3022697 RepID=UPI00233FF229|nr:precorrin-6y C5,15-methyltransferase (decarboxylating) subunit CbiE [Aneurinibacillus sp. Ricciae_BoGa-3]WCK56474.1 precorrin-6y C5,15-methyltransferase (decarboxylating) subunit CbiE [Aneurinibacillus sp. Ricciae_BoGa-3]
MSETIKLIGIGDEGKASLLPHYVKWIYESEVLIGGERQLSFFPDYEGETRTIKGGLGSLVDELRQEGRRVVILASGDPLFYGIGSYLASKVNIEIHPYVSSIQLAFARMGEKWQDAYVISLHGRSMRGLAQRIDGKEKVALLTDEENNPAKIASYLLTYQMTEYRAFIAENLGGDTERCRWMSLEEMADEEFSPLNIVILKKTEEAKVWPLGIDDEEFVQRKPDKGLLTKREIRILSISALNLKEDSVVWDIGTCTGSVAIEAAKIATEGQVFAIEKNEGDLENCRKNLVKFRTDITVLHGKAPDGLESFPDPDAVFIGGTAGGMEDILAVCCSRLRENGRIVLNAATIENLSEALEVFHKNGFNTNITLAQIARSKPILNLTRFDALNPIYIITASRKKGE